MRTWHEFDGSCADEGSGPHNITCPLKHSGMHHLCFSYAQFSSPHSRYLPFRRSWRESWFLCVHPFCAYFMCVHPSCAYILLVHRTSFLCVRPPCAGCCADSKLPISDPSQLALSPPSLPPTPPSFFSERFADTARLSHPPPLLCATFVWHLPRPTTASSSPFAGSSYPTHS